LRELALRLLRTKKRKEILESQSPSKLIVIHVGKSVYPNFWDFVFLPALACRRDVSCRHPAACFLFFFYLFIYLFIFPFWRHQAACAHHTQTQTQTQTQTNHAHPHIPTRKKISSFIQNKFLLFSATASSAHRHTRSPAPHPICLRSFIKSYW